MNIIEAINHKVQALVTIGISEDEARKVLTTELSQYPSRNPSMILEQAYVAMQIATEIQRLKSALTKAQ